MSLYTIKAAHQVNKLVLRETDLQPKDDCCPCCNSTLRRTVGLLQDSPTIDLIECRSCHATFASRIPTDEVLARYYRDFHDGEFSSHGHDITFDLPDKLASHIVQTTLRQSDIFCANSSLEIADFGGGDGTVALMIAEKLLALGARSVRVTVIDYGSELIKTTDSRIRATRTDSIEENGNYDLIIASASIAHLPTPRTVLPILFKALQTNGVLYVRTPHLIPIFKFLRCFGIRLDLAFPGQIPDMGPKFWKTIVQLVAPEVQCKLVVAQPSLVETSFRDHFLRTLIAVLMKAPWRLFGERYTFVGGWEVFFVRLSRENLLAED